jgi:hypothetical protein
MDSTEAGDPEHFSDANETNSAYSAREYTVQDEGGSFFLKTQMEKGRGEQAEAALSSLVHTPHLQRK